MDPARTAAESLPPTGEQTGPQAARGISDVAGLFGSSDQSGYPKPPPGTFATYREMRTDPTIAMARAIATAPAKTANFSFEEEDDAPKGAAPFITKNIGPIMGHLMHHTTYALDYGFQAFEKVVGLIPFEGRSLYGYEKLKPLVPDDIEFQSDAVNGRFAGLKQKRVYLPPDKCWVFTHDIEGTDMYGRSRMENLRTTVWPAAKKLFEREGVYVTKASGIIPMIQYPEGTSMDRHGREVSNFELAEKLLAHLGAGNGVTMPNTLAKWVEELANRGVTNPEALRAWIITFLEAKGSHGNEFVSLGGRHDQLKFRGWLVPERTAIEGSHGTLAEAEAHADIALMVIELLLDDVARYINWYMLDPLLVWNWGEAARGTVTIRFERLIDEQKSLLRDIIKTVLSGNVDALNDLVDLNAAMDILDLPKAGEQVALQTATEDGDAEALLTRAAGMGNDVTLDDTLTVAAASRYLHAVRNHNGHKRSRVRV